MVTTHLYRIRARKQTFFFIFPCSLLTKLHTRSYNFIVSEEREMKRIFLIVYTITRIFITNVRIPSGFIDCRAMIHRSSTISFLPIASNLQRITRKKKKKKKKGESLTGLVSGMASGGGEREKRNPVGRGPATSRHFRSADRRRRKRVAPSLWKILRNFR